METVCHAFLDQTSFVVLFHQTVELDLTVPQYDIACNLLLNLRSTQLPNM